VHLLPALCACGPLLTASLDRHSEGSKELEPPPPPHAVLIEGEIRDFATLQVVPGATIETWTEEPGYAPKASVDERGHFSVRIDVCRREATAGEQFFGSLVAGDTDTCTRYLRRYGLRAVAGDRCSIRYDAGLLEKERGPLTLWMRPCTDLRR
jgi:hypothetical protein